MPKKRKPHSKAARDQRLYSGMRAWMWESEPASTGDDFVLHVQQRMPPFGWVDITSRRIIDNLFDKPRNWVLCARAIAMSPDGTCWMEQADTTLTSCRLLTVDGAYDALREAVLSANKLSHVYDCGWIAQPWVGADPSDEDPDWVYHNTPPALAPHRRVVGADFSEERKELWHKAQAKTGDKP